VDLVVQTKRNNKMSYFEDFIEPYIGMFDDGCYKDEAYFPHVDDLFWIDKKGKSHDISKMDIEYVEAVIRFLNKKGFRDDIPEALFKRYSERHEVIMEEFDVLGEERK